MKVNRNTGETILTGRITSPKPRIDRRSRRHGFHSDSGMNKGKANVSGTTSPFAPIPNATCSITEGLFDVLVDDEPPPPDDDVVPLELDDR